MSMPRRWPRGYYTYILCYPDATPYYVGAGKNARANPNRKVFNGVCPQTLLEAEGKTTVIIIIEKENKEQAFQEEQRLIEKFGRQDIGTGPLFNITNGLGSRGYIKSASMREKIAAGHRDKPLSKEHRDKLRVAMLGNQHLLGHTHSKETRDRISVACRGKKLNLSDEERASRSLRMSERNRSNPPRKGIPCSTEHRRKISEARGR